MPLTTALSLVLNLLYTLSDNVGYLGLKVIFCIFKQQYFTYSATYVSLITHENHLRKFCTICANFALFAHFLHYLRKLCKCCIICAFFALFAQILHLLRKHQHVLQYTSELRSETSMLPLQYCSVYKPGCCVLVCVGRKRTKPHHPKLEFHVRIGHKVPERRF